VKKYCYVFPLIVFLCSTLVAQNTNVSPTVAVVFAVLTRSVDSKSATVGQEVTLLTMSNVTVDREVVIPKGSKLLGHILEIKVKGKDVPESVLSIIVDKAVRTDGIELSLQAIIAAVAAPQNDLSSDAVYGMMHSNEPKMVGTGEGSSSSTGELSSSSKAGSGAAVATAGIKGPEQALLLNENSQGAIGYEGLAISWQLTSPPPTTIFTTAKGKYVKLDAGAQMLLRMTPPHMPR